MKQYVGKKVILRVIVDGVSLSYTATINKVDKTHIHFTDKFGENLSYRIQDIIEIRERDNDK